jgi:hypothetical protein
VKIAIDCSAGYGPRVYLGSFKGVPKFPENRQRQAREIGGRGTRKVMRHTVTPMAVVIFTDNTGTSLVPIEGDGAGRWEGLVVDKLSCKIKKQDSKNWRRGE